MQLILLTIYKLPYMEITTTFTMMTKQTVNDTVNMHHQIFYLKEKRKRNTSHKPQKLLFWGGGLFGVGVELHSYIFRFNISKFYIGLQKK